MMTSEPTGNGELDEKAKPARRSVDDLTGLLEMSSDLAPRDFDAYASGLSDVRAPFHIRPRRDRRLWARFSLQKKPSYWEYLNYHERSGDKTDGHGPGEPILITALTLSIV